MCRMLGIILFVGFAVGATVPTTGAERPNILWLIAEDMGPELGCYGYPGVRTPNIDALAAEGVRFTHAYTTTPVCSTSRSSFMTGMYSQSIGTHNHRSHRSDNFQLPDGVKVFTDWLRPAGYYTANIKKFPTEVQLKGTGKTDWNFAYEGQPFDSDNWDDLSAHQPFYAQVNFSETHRGKAWDEAHLYANDVADPATVVIPPYYPDHEITRQDWAQYLTTIMALDKRIGKIFDLLKKQGLYDNTIVVFMSDHGQAMVRAKQWPYESGLHIPLIIRWPQSLPGAADFPPGTVDNRLVMSIDLTATTLSWAGVEKPAKMQGQVFSGPHKEPKREYVFGGRDRGDETVDRIRTVRDQQFRYIRNYYPERPFTQLNRYKFRQYPVLRLMHRLHDAGQLTGPAEVLMRPTRPPEELYDLKADPHEIHNLAEDPELKETLERLRGVLTAWIIEIDDQGRFPEDPAELQQLNRNPENRVIEELKKKEAGLGVAPW